MSVDTAYLLKQFDISDLNTAYSLAYLQQKGLPVNNNQVTVDKQWYFGEIHGQPLIKTEDNSLYLFNVSGCFESSDRVATDPDFSGNNLQERFLDIIAFLIANKHPTLPAKHIKIGTAINHNNLHWTSQLATFETLDNVNYQALYRAFYSSGKNDDTLSETVRRNNARNFIIEASGITTSVSKRSEAAHEITPGNLKLPLKIRNVSLFNFDSLGLNTPFLASVYQASKRFVQAHNAEYAVSPCPRQAGNTCGDWSLFNVFNHGVLARDNTTLSSEQLRALHFSCSLHNANELLYKNTPALVKPTAAQTIDRHADERRLASLLLPDHSNSLFDERGLDAPFPLLSILYSLLMGAAFAATTYYALIPLTTAAPLLSGLWTVSSFLLGATLFSDFMLKTLFGAIEVELAWDNGACKIYNIDSYNGYLLSAPVKMRLYQLESNIADILSEQNDVSEADRSALTQKHAREIVKQYPNVFYPYDVNAVTQQECDELTKKLTP